MLTECSIPPKPIASARTYERGVVSLLVTAQSSRRLGSIEFVAQPDAGRVDGPVAKAVDRGTGRGSAKLTAGVSPLTRCAIRARQIIEEILGSQCPRTRGNLPLKPRCRRPN